MTHIGKCVMYVRKRGGRERRKIDGEDMKYDCKRAMRENMRNVWK